MKYNLKRYSVGYYENMLKVDRKELFRPVIACSLNTCSTAVDDVVQL